MLTTQVFILVQIHMFCEYTNITLNFVYAKSKPNLPFLTVPFKRLNIGQFHHMWASITFG